MKEEKNYKDSPANKPHVFEEFVDDLCKCRRFIYYPIHIGGYKVENKKPEPVLK